MKKSPYDRERFFEKYSQMDRSRLGLAERFEPSEEGTYVYEAIIA